MNCPSNANKVTIRQNGLRGSTGAQGAQGIQGVQGIQGIQGVSGSQGIQGIQGIQGELGVQGLQGVQGSKGSQGTQGIQGFAGSQGTQGIQGITGGTGPIGSQGATGPSGDAGVQGATGVQGTVGIQGIQGIQGTTGTQGLTGTQGIVGAQGTDGPQGTQGIQGLTGVQGSTGVQGGQGTQGTTGIQGTQGTQGIQGSQAVVAILDENVSVVTSVASLDFSGSAVSASHVGNAVTVHVDTDPAGLFGDPYVLSTGDTYRTKTLANGTTLEYPGTPYSSSADFTAIGGPNYTAFQRNGSYDGTVKLDLSLTLSGSTEDLFSQTGSYMEFTVYGINPSVNGVIHGGPSENKKHSVNISQIGTVVGNIYTEMRALGSSSGSYYYISNLIVTPVNTTF